MQKGECRPMGDSNYMKLKMKTIRDARQPTRLVQQLEKAVVSFKPVAAHRNEVNDFFTCTFFSLYIIYI